MQDNVSYLAFNFVSIYGGGEVESIDFRRPKDIIGNSGSIRLRTIYSFPLAEAWLWKPVLRHILV